MAPRITPWLGELVVAELRAVLQWRTLIKQEPDVEHVQEERFSDDGSNFRSNVMSPPLGDESKLQIMNIVSTDKLSFVVVSDGVTQIRAFLSDDTVTVLEEEMGSPLISGMQGDLLIIREMTIISTPWGSEDGYIQINIDEIEYAGHLRKVIGQPGPIEQRPDIASLITEIGDLRRKQDTSDNISLGTPFQGGTQSSNAATPSSRGLVPNVTDNQSGKQGLKRARPRSASPIALTQVPRHDQVATQNIVRGKTRPTTTSLCIDGFEIDSGLNLSGPRQPTTAPILSSTSSPKKARLFNLLKNVAGTKSDKHEPEVRRVTTSRSGSSLATSIQDNPSQGDQTPLRLDTCTSRPSPPMTTDQFPTQPDLLPDIDDVQSSGQKPTERLKSDADNITSQPAFVVADRLKVYEGQFAPGTLSSDCSEYDDPDNVSREQQSLLDDPSCWMPSYVGQQLPVPNIPVSLIRQWQVLLGAEKVLMRPDLHGSDISETSSGTDSNDTSPSIESITKDQWPSSPVRDALPPDSTLEQNSSNINDGSAVGQHPVLDGDIELLPVRQRTPPSDFEIDQSVAQPSLPLRSPAPKWPTQRSDASVATGSRHSSQATPSGNHPYDAAKPKSLDFHVRNLALSATERYPPAYSARPDTPNGTNEARCEHAEWLASQDSSGRARLPPADVRVSNVNAHHLAGSFYNVVDQPRETARSTDRCLSKPLNLDTSSPRRSSSTATHAIVQSSQSCVPLSTPPHPPSSPSHIRRRYHHDDQNQVQLPLSPDRIMVKSTQFLNDRDEMEMGIPVPLEDPAIIHRRRRREHFNTIRRQSERSDKNPTTQDLQINASKRRQIDTESTQPQPSSQRIEVLTGPVLTSKQKEAYQSQVTRPNCKPSTHSEQSSNQTVASTTDNQYPFENASRQPSSIVGKRQIPLIDLAQDDILSEQQPVDQKCAPGANTSRRPHPPLNTLNATDSPVTAHGQPSDVFREFAQTWNGITPGGAFASRQPQTRQRKEAADWKVDVLSWGWD